MLPLLLLLPQLINGQGCCPKKLVGADEYMYSNSNPGEVEGFGCFDSCVYLKNGQPGDRYCFGPGDLDVVCDAEMTTTTTTIKAATTTTTIPALLPPCTSDGDCQENAKCLGTEIKDVFTTEGPKVCQCRFGYHAVLGLDTENDIYPKTGTCVNLMENGCQYPELCKVDGKYTYCPFCKVFETSDDGEKISYGTYDSYSKWEYLMRFKNGDKDGCSGGSETSVTVECWLEKYPNGGQTSLDNIAFSTRENTGCKLYLNIYTPMHCMFALN